MKYTIAGIRVMIAVPVNRDFPWQTTMSLIQTVAMLHDKGIGYEIKFCVGGSIVQKSRSHLADMFLTSNCDRLFMIDSDMAWSPEDAFKLICKSTMMDVVGASYPQKSYPITFLTSMDADGPVRTNEHGCVPIKGMGLGFTIVRRKVIEGLAHFAPKVKNDDGTMMPMVFHIEIEDDVFVGEDIQFFRDCAKLGAEVWCDPSIELGHVGDVEYRGQLAECMKKVG
jgi:hypothetical protein